MNKESDNKYKFPEQAKDNPFSVPDGYFDSFSGRLMERLEGERETVRLGAGEKRGTIWMRIRPQLSLAAAILGFALISITLMKVLIGTGNMDESYDLSFLDQTGILNESVFQETLAESDEYSDEVYSDWEVEAMNYLASNEVNLEALLSEN